MALKGAGQRRPFFGKDEFAYEILSATFMLARQASPWCRTCPTWPGV
jgi:hypothetical protein